MTMTKRTKLAHERLNRCNRRARRNAARFLALVAYFEITGLTPKPVVVVL